MTIEITKHLLVPKHSKVSASEMKNLLEKYNIEIKSLPKIIHDDPAIVKLNVKLGDVIKIERDSPTAGKSTYYRVVVDG